MSDFVFDLDKQNKLNMIDVLIKYKNSQQNNIRKLSNFL